MVQTLPSPLSLYCPRTATVHLHFPGRRTGGAYGEIRAAQERTLTLGNSREQPSQGTLTAKPSSMHTASPEHLHRERGRACAGQVSARGQWAWGQRPYTPPEMEWKSYLRILDKWCTERQSKSFRFLKQNNSKWKLRT